MRSEIINMYVVPVKIIQKFDAIVKTYAMLENCSQATFVKECLLGYLGLRGRKTSIVIKAMNEEIARIFRVLKDLEASQISEKKEERRWVKLPTRFTEKY